MAKKIRFPLDMGNGIEVRTLEELQDNFSVEKVLGYYADGKLMIWLKDRYLDDIADAISKLDKDDSDFVKKVCAAFGVEYNEEVNMQTLEERNRKLALLKQYTDEKEFFDVVDNIAFSQDELYDLLDENMHTIYLCGDRFSIPLSKKGIKYIGINQPILAIHAKEIVDWKEKNIELIGIRFDDMYQSLLDESDNNLIGDFNVLQGDELIGKLEKEIENETLLANQSRYMLYQINEYVCRMKKMITIDVKQQLEYAFKNGYKAALIRYTLDYGKDDEKARLIETCCKEDYMSLADWEDEFIVYEMGLVYLEAKMNSKASGLVKKAAEMGCWLAENCMGNIEKDTTMANAWYQKAALKGVDWSYIHMVYFYVYNLGELREGTEYIRNAFKNQSFKEWFQSIYADHVRNLKCYIYERPFSTLGWRCPSPGSITGKIEEVDNRVKQEFQKLKNLMRTVCISANNKEINELVSQYISAYKDNLKWKLLIEAGEGNIDSFSVDLKEFEPVYEEIRKKIFQVIENFSSYFDDDGDGLIYFDVDMLQEGFDDEMGYYDDYRTWHTGKTYGFLQLPEKSVEFNPNNSFVRNYDKLLSKISNKVHESMVEFFTSNLL